MYATYILERPKYYTQILRTMPGRLTTHSPTESLAHTLSPSSCSFASVLRPQGRLTFHSGSVSIPCDHSHAASPPLKVTVVVCQNSNKNTPCIAPCVRGRVFVCEGERRKERKRHRKRVGVWVCN